MSAISEGSTQAFSDLAELQRRMDQIANSGPQLSEPDSTAVTLAPSMPANLRVAELITAFENANRTSLMGTRLLVAYYRRSGDTDSAAIPLPHSVDGWTMFGVFQPLDDVSYALRLPFYDRPCDPANTRLIPNRLDCDIYYNPVEDACLLVNMSYVDIYLRNLDPAASRIRLSYGETIAVGPGEWRISVEMGRNRIEQHLVIFFILQRQFTVAFRDGQRDFPRTAKRLACVEEQPNAKRQRREGDVQGVLLATTGNPGRERPEVIGASTALKPAATFSQQIDIVVHGASLLDLSDGEVAAVTTKQSKHTEISCPSLAITRSGSPCASKTPTYSLSRLGPIANTPSASLFSVRHSELPKVAVAKVIKCKGDKAKGLVMCARVWKREVSFLRSLHHVNIVSLLAYDSRFFLIIVEHLPPSLNRQTQSSFKPNDVNTILRDLSSALTYLHSKKIVHNDIKPANIAYSPLRGAVLLDFGLATSVDEKMMTGGTPWYIPPVLIVERQRGAPGDVWALGVTMLYVLQKIRLPEKTTKGWLIRDVVEHNGDAQKQMSTWLLLVGEKRKMLNCHDFVEDLVSQMLQLQMHSRIQFAQIAAAFEVPQRKLLQDSS